MCLPDSFRSVAAAPTEVLETPSEPREPSREAEAVADRGSTVTSMLPDVLSVVSELAEVDVRGVTVMLMEPEVVCRESCLERV